MSGVAPPCVNKNGESSTLLLTAYLCVSVRSDCGEAREVHISMRDASGEPCFGETEQATLPVSPHVPHKHSQLVGLHVPHDHRADRWLVPPMVR